MSDNVQNTENTQNVKDLAYGSGPLGSSGFGSAGVEAILLTATNMSISPSETPCITGICTVTVTVTWTNTGGAGTFTPRIIVNSTPYSLAPVSVLAGAYVTSIFEISGLPAGNYTICPDPN